MSTGRVLQLFFILFGIARCKGKYFVIDGLNTSDISTLTPDLEVNGEFRYPCYVSVLVYTSPALTKVYEGATVYVLTRSREDKQNYYGYSEATTNEYGQACLLTLCRKEALIYVEAGKTNERLFSVGQSNQRLPPGYTYTTDKNEQFIIFNVRNWGVVYGKTGPVYNLEENAKCQNAKADQNHFRFSFISIEEKLTGADLTTHLKLMSWYYPYPLTDTFQVCYMKIKVITPLFQAKVSLESLEASSMKLFGTYTAGPKSLPSVPDNVQKAACMEFRCAGRDNTLGTEVVMNTTVIGWVSGSSVKDCRIVGNAKLTNVDTNATYFKTTIRANNNYGSSFGIYKNPDKETAKSMCYTGKDHLINGYTMDPNTNYFISFDCTSQDKIVDRKFRQPVYKHNNNFKLTAFVSSITLCHI